VIRGKTEKVRDAVFLAYRTNQRSARVGDWKLIRYPLINRTRLFNLKEDPDETKDLSCDGASAEKVRELTAALEQLQKEYDDVLPLTSAQPLPEKFDPPRRGK
jgi:arylsulfatase A-like enzyme